MRWSAGYEIRPNFPSNMPDLNILLNHESVYEKASCIVHDHMGIAQEQDMDCVLIHPDSTSWLQPFRHSSIFHPFPPTEQQTLDVTDFQAVADSFKLRRIRLGYTQADVGKQLGHLSIPGVGPLSQSTICRFESLTLSHNNMVALRPILKAWMETAECSLPNKCYDNLGGKKRNRTAIVASEKRILEEHFTNNPRPSRQQLSDLANGLGLDKKVVRIWFCNRRQKRKQIKIEK